MKRVSKRHQSCFVTFILPNKPSVSVRKNFYQTEMHCTFQNDKIAKFVSNGILPWSTNPKQTMTNLEGDPKSSNK